jgi:hypothetical protein
MSIDEAIAHGRAWVEAGWAWAPGQVAITWIDDMGMPPIIGVVTRVLDGTVVGFAHADDGVGRLSRIAPDMRDPGTRGHALDQVLASRGSECVYLLDTDTRVFGGWCAELRLWEGDLSIGDECFEADGETRAVAEARALLAARKAAPK